MPCYPITSPVAVRRVKNAVIAPSVLCSFLLTVNSCAIAPVHAGEPVVPTSQHTALSFSPKAGESMAGYLGRVSKRSGMVFVCSPTCLRLSPKKVLPQSLSATAIAGRLARATQGGLVKKGQMLILLPPLTGYWKKSVEFDAEFWQNTNTLLGFVDTFTEKQITDILAGNQEMLPLDDMTPAQVSHFWKLNKDHYYVPEGEKFKKVSLGFCRTKSLNIGPIGKDSLGYLGIFSYTSGGVIVDNPAMRTVKPMPIASKTQPGTKKKVADSHGFLMKRYAGAGFVPSQNSIEDNLRLLQSRTGTAVRLAAGRKISRPYVSVASLRADHWYDCVTTFCNLQEDSGGAAYTLVTPPPCRGLSRPESLRLMQAYHPNIFYTHNHLVKSVRAKLTRLPEPSVGVPFEASAFATPFEDAPLHKFSSLNATQKDWVRFFIRHNSYRTTDHEALNLDKSEFWLRDTLWMYGFMGSASFHYEID